MFRSEEGFQNAVHGLLQRAFRALRDGSLAWTGSQRMSILPCAGESPDMTTWHEYVRLWRGRSPHSTVHSGCHPRVGTVPVDDGLRWCGVILGLRLADTGSAARHLVGVLRGRPSFST